MNWRTTLVANWILRIVALMSCATAPALAQSLSLSHYVHTAWHLSDLQLDGPITAIAQTRDGYLWLGTEAGLFRFDGVRARRWQPPDGTPLPSEEIRSLTVSRDGTLWIGTGKGLASWNNNRLTIRADVPARRVFSMLEDSRGTVWIALGNGGGGVCAVQGDAARCDQIRSGASAVFEDSRGTIWVIAGGGPLWRWAPVAADRRMVIPVGVVSIAEDEAGNVIAKTTRTIRSVTSDSLRPGPLVSAWTYGTPFRSRDGAIWISTGTMGLLHLHRGRFERFGVADGLSADAARPGFEDGEGNVWIRTEGGLDRFRLSITDAVFQKRGITNQAASSIVTTADGSVWIGTRTGLQRWRDGEVTLFRVPKGTMIGSRDVPTRVDQIRGNELWAGLANHIVYTTGTDAAGRLWIYWAQGAAYFDHGHFVPASPGLERPFHVAPGDSGTTWTAGGFLGTVVREVLPNGEVRIPDSALIKRRGGASAFLFDARLHGMWVGFEHGGLARFSNGRAVAQYDTSDGLTRDRVRHLRLATDGAVWATTSTGVSRIDTAGHVHTLTAANGLPCARLDWSFEGNDGTLWLYGVCGLIRISASDVAAWRLHPDRAVQSRIFAEDDGVIARGVDGNLSAFTARTGDGRFWFVAGDGIEILDPRRVPMNDRPPSARVEEVTADGRGYDADTATRHRLELPARIRNLEIRYSASSLINPEKVRFRFKLEGQDPQWREVVNQRRVQYSNLRPGTYDFRLMASNNDGVWSTPSTPLTVHVPPAWNQTWWFFVLVGLAIAASAGGSAAAWQRQRTQARFDATVAERTRVARELHDTLLGDMAGVAMQLNAGAKRAEVSGADGPAIVELLSSLGKQVQQTLTEARRAVTAMRTDTGETSVPLHSQIAHAAARIFAGSEIVARVTHAGSPRPSAPEVTADIVHIATEAMTNARRHAQCRAVTVECQYAEHTLVVSVRDDGRGFEPSQSAPAGHWGLVGMRERASAVGATLSVSSAPRFGTEVLLKVPTA